MLNTNPLKLKKRHFKKGLEKKATTNTFENMENKI